MNISDEEYRYKMKSWCLELSVSYVDRVLFPWAISDMLYVIDSSANIMCYIIVLYRRVCG